jgi:processive 1,2-diacylglycerol beta-glucosyltransferase/1,2-diacylglycerol 3-beta-galactosyltransferase
MKEKRKYLLAYLKTGGGHLAPAKAVHNYVRKNFSESVETKLIYGFEKAPRWVRFIIEDGYRILQYKGRWFFEFLYAMNKIPLFGKLSCYSVAGYMSRYLEKTILDEKPDKIIIFHFFLIQPICKILRRHNLKTETYTIVTDPFTPHPMWFMWRNINFIVFSEKLKERINKKFSKNIITSFPFILDDKFSKRMNSEDKIVAKSNLKFDVSKKVVLILGGGDGIPKGKRILQKLLKAKLSAQIAIVCGKNNALLKSANELKEKYQSGNLKIYGYVDFIYELINICDVVITKCGASTIMEILNLGKVSVVNDYIWEQEQGNIDYLREKKLGIYEPKIKMLPSVIKNLLDDEELYSFYKTNIKNEDIRNGVKEVSEYLIDDSNLYKAGEQQ